MYHATFLTQPERWAILKSTGLAERLPIRPDAFEADYSFGAALITATNLAWAASGVID